MGDVTPQKRGRDEDTVTPLLHAAIERIPGARRPQASDAAPEAFVPPGKLFNDPIHGHIEVDALCVRIIDTRQFQRLRDIKQLGACYYVFPGGCHNRFEHSIGVMHLAGKLVEALRQKQPLLGITAADVLCVKIAGLCHDLGHGPFSHMFDGYFIPLATGGIDWKHEDGSIMMFDHLVKENHLMPDFAARNMGDDDIAFIKDLILGKKSRAPDTRTNGKEFLFEIVANKRNAIDVDKLDYFARDCQYLGMKATYDHGRILMNARVALGADGTVQICHPVKEDWQMYEIFHTRLSLHKRAYQHRVAKIVEYMICEAMLLADPYLQFPCKGGTCKLSDSIRHPDAYSYITDSILILIRMSTDPKLAPAKRVLQRIDMRDLYRFVGMGVPKERYSQDKIEEIRDAIAQRAPPGTHLRKEDIVVHLIDFDYGMKDANPIDAVNFYSKRNPDYAAPIRKELVSSIAVPTSFREQQLRVYCKESDEGSIKATMKCLRQWAVDTKALLHDHIDQMDVLLPNLTTMRLPPAQPDAEDQPAKKQRVDV